MLKQNNFLLLRFKFIDNFKGKLHKAHSFSPEGMNIHLFIQQIFTEYQSKQGTVLGTGDTRMGTGMTVCLCVLTHVCACVCVCVCIHIQLNKLKLHIIAF